jgi:hypothetical protein
MHPHRSLEIFPGHVFERADFDDASVVDQYVDLAETVDRFANGQLNLVGIEEIGLNRERFAAAAGQIRLCAGKLISVSRYNPNFAAFSANLSRKYQTEATRTAGDECDFVS